MTPEKFTYHFFMAAKGNRKHLAIVVEQVDLLIKLIEAKKNNPLRRVSKKENKTGK